MKKVPGALFLVGRLEVMIARMRKLACEALLAVMVKSSLGDGPVMVLS